MVKKTRYGDDGFLSELLIAPGSALRCYEYCFRCSQFPQSHTNGLPDCIQVVGDLEVRQVLANFLRHFLWGEAHGSYVVGTQGELALWSLHELHGCAVAVRDVHHGKACFGT